MRWIFGIQDGNREMQREEEGRVGMEIWEATGNCYVHAPSPGETGDHCVLQSHQKNHIYGAHARARRGARDAGRGEGGREKRTEKCHVHLATRSETCTNKVIKKQYSERNVSGTQTARYTKATTTRLIPESQGINNLKRKHILWRWEEQ